MESDLSSSDGALRMLFVEDVELLDKGILMSSGLSLWEESRRSALSDPCGGCAARTEIFFTGLLILWGHLFAASDVTHANLALINQYSSDTSYTDTDRPENTHIYVYVLVCLCVKTTFYAHRQLKGEVAPDTLVIFKV